MKYYVEYRGYVVVEAESEMEALGEVAVKHGEPYYIRPGDVVATEEDIANEVFIDDPGVE